MQSARDIPIYSPGDALLRSIRDKLNTEESAVEILESKSSSESESSNRIKSSLSSEFDPLASLNREILQNLDYSNTKEEKLEALNVILQSRCESSHSLELLRILQELLNDDDKEIFEITLEIHEKLMKSSWETLKNAFINLLETLYVHYFQLGTQIIAVEYPHRNAFKIYKLVLNTLYEVFLHVSSIGYSRLEKIIGNFVDLVFFTTKINETLTPLHIVSSLDPSALWCKVMLHAATSREILFKCMRRNKNIVACVFLVISDWMCSPFVPAKAADLSFAEVRYATFVSCIRCCSHLSAYQSFYNQFPVVVESKFVISLNTFTTSLVSFVKSRSKVIAEPVARTMLDCCVHLLSFQPSETLALQLQCILEMCNGKYARKHLLELVKRILDDRGTVDRTMSAVMYAKSRVGPNGKLLRPRLYSSASNNVFVCLMNTIVRTIRSEHQSTVVNALGLCRNVLRTHEFYLICGPDSYLVTEFMELLASKCERHKTAGNSAISRLMRDEDFIFAVGSTPLGFHFVASTHALSKVAVTKLEKFENRWMYMPGRNVVQFLVGCESQIHMNTIYEKMSTKILTLIKQIEEYDCTNEKEVRRCTDDVLIFVDILATSVTGIRSLMNQTHSEETSDVRNFANVIEKYAFANTHDDRMQHVALRSLQIMITNFNVKVFLLCLYDYEKCLSEIQENYVSSSGKLIRDECSLLRAELLRENVGESVHQNYSSRVKSTPKVKLSRRKLSEIEKFLQKTRHGPFDNNWLKYARKCFKMSLSSNLKVSVTLELIEKISKSITRSIRIGSIVTTNVNDSPILRAEDLKGIRLAVSYGVQNQMLQENSQNEQNLIQVMKTVRAFIGYHESEDFETFDVTLATFFIICGGSVEKCLHIVACVIPLPVSVYIWPQVTPNNTKKKYLFGHLTEWLLYQEVPNVFAALTNYGISWWLICKRKLDCCFWNTIAWVEIYRWVCVTLLHSPDNLIYYFTSVAYKNEGKILQATMEVELLNVLHTSFGSHLLEEHVIYMDYLEKKYHSYLSSFLMD